MQGDGKIVPPDGDPNARISFMGARPGRDEVSEGRGFVGASGRLLWRLCPISRSECYVTNVRKDFSPINDTPTKAEIHSVLPDLFKEMSTNTSNVIVALGGHALYALTGLDSIEKYRGSVIKSTLLSGRKVFATWHPAACLRAYQQTYVLERDLRRAFREAQYPDIRRPNRTYALAPSFENTIQYIRSLDDPISLDIETFGDNPSCISIADKPSRAICIPFIGGHYSTSELGYIWRELDKVFRTRRIIGQNIQFDTTRLERWGFRLPRLFFDTMLAHHLLWPELGGASKRSQSKREGIDALAGKHSLAFLVSIYTEEPYYKDEGGFNGDFERYWTYNCKDAACTFECYLGLQKELEAYGQSAYFQEHVMGLIRPVMGMQSRGLCVNFETLNKTRDRLTREVQLLQMRFNQNMGFQCNVRSTEDIKFLYERLNVKPTKRTPKGNKPSTDEDTLRTLAYNSPHAATFQAILEIRERRTLISGFLGLETDDDGRYKANYLIHGADSGRLSSRAARKGPQLQNVPEAARRVFVSPNGHTFISGDYRRAEAMFVAYDACEQGLIDLFNDNSRDLYKEVAQEILGREVAAKGIERRCFKTVVLSSNYGVGPRKLLMVFRLQGIDIDEIEIPGIYSNLKKAEYVIESYFRKYKNLRVWQREICDRVHRTRTLHDALGRRRIFLGRMDDHLDRIALSFRPQSSVVGLTNRALRILEAQEQTVSQVHDSIMLEVPDGEVEDGIRRLEEAMTFPLEIHGRKMVIPVDIQVGQSWGDLHAWEKPQ